MANALTNLKIGEVSFCRKGMNQHARVALFKSADAITDDAHRVAKATFQEALEGNMIAGAVNEAFFESFDGLWERNDAFRCALTDELAAGGDGTAASAAYVASVKQLVDDAVAAAREAGATAADTTTIDKALTDAATAWLQVHKSTKEQSVMTITTKAALLAAVAKFDPTKSTVADMAEIHKAATDLNLTDQLPVEGPLALTKAPDADLVRKVAILEMPADVRKHFDALPEADQPAFLAKSADARAEIVAKANETDPVVYVTKSGIDIRKSEGATVLALAKANDAQAEQIAKLTGGLTNATLETRAAAYPNVAKSVAVDMLKSVDQLGADTDAGKAVSKSLALMNKGGAALFKAVGSTGDDADDATIAKAQGDFDAKVGEIAKRDNITRSAAMSKARTEAPDLFAAAYPEPVTADAE